MSPMEVARRLEETPLLGGGRGPVARHQSLVAAIEWSYRLLPEAEQRLFRSMSVFVGGADLRGSAPGRRPGSGRGRRARPADPARRPVHGGGRQRGPQPVPAAGDPAGLRAVTRTEAEGADADAGPAARRVLRGAGRARGARACRARTSGRGWRRPWPTTTTCAPRSCRHGADRDWDLAVRLVGGRAGAGAPARSGTRRPGGPSGVLDDADPDHPRYVAAVGAAARGAWNRGEFALAAGLARAGGRPACRRRGPRASPTRGTSWPTSRSTRGTSTAPCGTTRRRPSVPAPTATGSGWSGRSYYVAVCQAVRREPQRGLAAGARRASRWRRRRPTRRRGRWPATRSAWC